MRSSSNTYGYANGFTFVDGHCNGLTYADTDCYSGAMQLVRGTEHAYSFD